MVSIEFKISIKLLEQGKSSSLVVIFSVWKTMVGTAVLSLPWAFELAGIALGLIISLVSFLISFYTCKLIVDQAGDDADYSITLKKYYGKTLTSS
jgi:amino acid permease